MSNLSEVFDDIYRHDRWGNGSGPGSNPKETREFYDYCRTIKDAKFVRSALDIGCGDGQSVMPLGAYEQEYLGVDVSSEAISRFRSNARRACVQMNAADAVWYFDFVLIKDVLQHLPTDECRRMLNAVSKCQTVWVINDAPATFECGDCEPGGYRPIDPRYLQDGFRLRGQYMIAGFQKALWEWSPLEA